MVKKARESISESPPLHPGSGYRNRVRNGVSSGPIGVSGNKIGRRANTGEATVDAKCGRSRS